jgi:hypothetical protein
MFIIYWRRQVEKTPQLDNPENNIKLSVAEFQKRLKLAYEQGRSDEREIQEDGGALSDLFPWLKK